MSADPPLSFKARTTTARERENKAVRRIARRLGIAERPIVVRHDPAVIRPELGRRRRRAR